MFFSRNVTYIPPLSDSSLWLLSKALDFWEILILKSAPTLHLIWYAIIETLYFIHFGSFSMFIRWYCIKRPFPSTLCSFLFCIVIVNSEPFFGGGLFLDWFCCYQTENVCRLTFYGLKWNWNKRNSFLNSIW